MRADRPAGARRFIESLEERVLLSASENSDHGLEHRRSVKEIGPAQEAPSSNFTPSAANLSTATNVDISKRSGYEGEGTIAIDPTNANRMFAASNIASGTGIFVAYSTDGGTTWTSRIMGTGTGTGGDGLPAACCDSSSSWDQFGNLWVGYIKTSGVTQTVITRSTDGGKTFSLVKTFTAADQPTVTSGPGNVAGTGSVWATWRTSSGLVAAGAQVTGLGSAVTFTAAEAVPSSSAENYADVSIGPNGAVMVAAQDNTGGQGISNIRVAVDPDGVGASGFGAAVLPTTTNVGGFDYLPAQSLRSVDAEVGLAWDHTGGAHNGRAYMIYTQEIPDESNDFDILLRYSDNSGSTWSSPIRVNDDATTRSQMLPRIALDPTSGNIAITWLDARNDAGDHADGDTNGVANDDVQVWGTISTSGGTSFNPNIRISSGTSRAGAQSNGNDFGDYTGLAFYNGVFYPIWPDNSGTVSGYVNAPNFDMVTAKVSINAVGPSNDNFASRISLTGTSTSTTGSNVSGSKESGEPNHAGNAGGASVWWTWNAPTSQSYVISTSGSSFNTLLGVYTGSSVSALTTIASNDDENAAINTSRVVFNAVAGTTYQIAVDGFGGATGNIALAISLATHTISGNVFADRDTSGTQTAGESSQSGVVVYLDSNNNGSLDTGVATPASNAAVAIPDVSTITSPLSVSNVPGAITDVNVTVNITHTFDADLDVFLISPSGTRIELFTDDGAGGQNFTNTTLDDEAATSVTAGTAPFTGSFKPEGLLSTVDGQVANGTWTLEVTDDASSDTGTLNSWSLAISYAEVSTPTDGSGNYSFTGLTSGTYNVREVAPVGFVQTTPAAIPRTVVAQLGQTYTGQTFGNFPVVYTGSAANDSYTIGLLADTTTLQIVETLGANSPVTYTTPKALLGSNALSFSGGSLDDSFTINQANGSPTTSGGITIAGGANSAGDSLTINGTANADALSVFSTSVSFGGTISYSTIETLIINTLDGNDTLNQQAQPGAPLTFNGGTSTTVDTLNVNVGAATFSADASAGTSALALNLAGGTTAMFNATQHLASLSIGPSATATVATNGSRVLVTRALTVDPTGKLNLTNNDLIVRGGTLGSWNGSAYTGLTALVASGRAGGAWNGFGIDTSAASSSSHTGLGIASPAGTTVFDGETVDSTCVLVKYTYTGDANLDGVVNGDDLTIIDNHYNIPGTAAYASGDFDLNGKLNPDDYAIIDSTMNVQSGVL